MILDNVQWGDSRLFSRRIILSSKLAAITRPNRHTARQLQTMELVKVNASILTPSAPQEQDLCSLYHAAATVRDSHLHAGTHWDLCSNLADIKTTDNFGDLKPLSLRARLHNENAHHRSARGL